MTGDVVGGAESPDQGSRASRLRAAAIALFAGAVTMGVLTVVLASGLAAAPGIVDADELGQPGLVLFALGLGSGGLLIAWHRPTHAAAWLLLAAADLETLCDLGQAYGARALTVDPWLPAGTWALSLSAPLWIVGVGLLAVVLLLRYPSGRVAGRWARRVHHGVLGAMAVLWAVYATSDNSVTDTVATARPPVRLDAPAWLQACVGALVAVVLVGGFGFAVVDAVIRTVRSSAPERQQLALLLTSVLVAVVGLLLPWRAANLVVAQAIPAAVAVGVLRYRLSGIDVVVRRTLLYGALTGLVLLVLVTVTWAVADFAPSVTGSPLIVAVVVAVLVVPLRDRLQRGVDRFVYGDRTTPWRAFESIGDLSPDTPAPARVLQALSEALRLPGIQLWSGHANPDADMLITSSRVGAAPPPDLTPADSPASAPTPASAASSAPLASAVPAAAPGRFVVPLVVEGRTIASLVVHPRRGERTLPRADRELLVAVAPLFALLVRSVELSELLREEHQRVADSVAAERDRLRRDLHDGLGPALTGIGLGLEAVAGPALPQRTQDIVARVRVEVTTCLDDVRRILDDLRPAPSSGRALVDHIVSRAEHLTATTVTDVRVVADPALPTLPGHVEEGLTRIADEALTNVVRHAAARTCTVTLSYADDAVVLVVEDDGVGFRGPRPGGIGVPSMHARVLALGGVLRLEAAGVSGTRLTARVPLGAETAARPDAEVLVAVEALA